MKILNRGFGLALLLTLALQVRAENVVRYEAEPGSKVKLDGTSTIHDWVIEGQIIGGFMETDVAFENDKLKSIKIKSAESVIPVRSLKSGKKRMDEVMQEAMNQPKFPKIQYKLAAMEAKKAPDKAGMPFQFEATGLLTISGVTRTNKMQVNVEAVDKQRLKVTGTTMVKMTDHGIKPPAPSILGMSPIKTGDDVKVSIEWITGPAVPEKK